MQEMGLPVKGLVDGLLDDMAKDPELLKSLGPLRLQPDDSAFLGYPNGTLARAFAIELASGLARAQGRKLPDAVAALADSAHETLKGTASPAARALVLGGQTPADEEVLDLLDSVTAEMPTLERALALEWIRQALDHGLTAPPETTRLPAPWVKETGRSGRVSWIWPEAKLPAELRLEGAPAPAVSAVVQFESAAFERTQWPVGLTRQIFHVVKVGDEKYSLEPVAAGTPFVTDELYLDDVTVKPGRSAIRYAVLEVPLPPGASVENTTWGIQFATLDEEGDEIQDEDGNAKLVGLERARNENTRFGYAVPVDGVGEIVHIRHLLRFAQKGSFVLPRARMYRMYVPEAKAFDAGPGLGKLEVQ